MNIKGLYIALGTAVLSASFFLGAASEVLRAQTDEAQKSFENTLEGDLSRYGRPALMTNVYGRDLQSLNGKWNAIIDLYDMGRGKKVWENRTAQNDEEFFEYSFDGALELNVPGDFNSQRPELQYYEGTVWYARHFSAGAASENERLFLYFCAVSYRCTVYLNGEEIGSHEGGFTPFQFEVTGKVKEGDNFITVEVNNRRSPDAIPAMSFDWWNYGGITRDVFLVRTPRVYIEDYMVQLDPSSSDRINASVRMSSASAAGSGAIVEIPELGCREKISLDSEGCGSVSFKARKLQRWSPDSPKLYNVRISYEGSDGEKSSIEEKIGFRNISVDGTRIKVNGKPEFIRCVSFHEEIPQRMGRAFSEDDAFMLLSEAKALGANTVRLAHYPQNEYIVRLAERLGIMLWEEIPVWQKIDFGNPETMDKALRMYSEMIFRDKNRCAVSFWGVANETRPGESRNAFLRRELALGRALDPTRLFTAAFDNVYYKSEWGEFRIEDPFIEDLDVVSFNKYMGWYAPWPAEPSECRWNVAEGKPVIISEFGCEALYGRTGDASRASSWSEDFQAAQYRKNLEMFSQIPNLAGISPWILFDFRSPFRFHRDQDGWNRKGLVSDQGQRKKAWYIIRDYYAAKAEEYRNAK